MQRQQEDETRKLQAEHRQQEEQSRQYKQRVTNSDIPARFLAGNLDNYDPTDNAAALLVAEDYVNNFDEHRKTGRGLLMIGKVGRGKTRLATTIAMEIMQRGHTVKYTSVVSLLDRIKTTYDSSGVNEFEIMEKLSNCSLLILDDYGKEKASEWAEERIFQIINDRYDKCRPLIITTNIGLGDIVTRYPWSGEAVVSRLYEICKGVMLQGPDRRRPK